MRKFDLSKLEGKVVVNCKTEDDSNAFLIYLDSEGVTWFIGNSTLDCMSSVFKVHKDETCFVLGEFGITYGSIKYHKVNGYKILDLSEIEIFETSQQPTPKNNFKEYGFEADFEGEILKVIDKNYYGIVKQHDKFETITWNLSGRPISGSTALNKYELWNLTPIKKPWYTQEDNFEKYRDKLIINKFGEVRRVQSVDSSKVSTIQQNMYHDILTSQKWRLVTENEFAELIYKEDK